MKRLGLSTILLLTACITAPTVTPARDAPVAQPTKLAHDAPVPQGSAAPAETKSAPAELATHAPNLAEHLPSPDAPLCPDTGEAHDNSLFHTLWDGVRDCHYDHEHGQNPFTPDVAAAFPGFDLYALLGNVGIGHTNPSSPMENTMKHGGMKWQVQTTTPRGCSTGFEGAQYGVDAAVIQYHSFGDYSIEFEARVHSSAALLRQCVPGSTDNGYLYVVQFQEYGQRVTPYQGIVLSYPDPPAPSYPSPSGPYFTVDCVGTGIGGCRSSRQFALGHNANSIWTSKPTGTGVRPDTSVVFRLLFRTRDNYQLLDSGDLVYPFHFVWLCSGDGGATYLASSGCRYNNSTSRVHEIAGDIPAEWDNLGGFDTNPAVGRITAEGYVTRFGTLNQTCTAPSVGDECFPIKMVNAYVGYYGTQLIEDKTIQFSPASQPERDIYFCGDQVCAEGDPGALASGWIGPNN